MVGVGIHHDVSDCNSDKLGDRQEQVFESGSGHDVTNCDNGN